MFYPIVLVLAAALLAAEPAHAQDVTTQPGQTEPTPRHRLVYGAPWRRFELVDYISTAAFGAAYFYVEFFTDDAVDPNWTGPIWFDKSVRNALVGETRSARNRAAFWSDILWYVPMLTPLVESAFVPLVSDDWNWDVAWQLSAINLQAAAVSGLLTRSGHHFVARARPDTGPCLHDHNYDDKCFGGTTASFPSGHTSTAFLGAGLACAHHSNLPLYGGGVPDVSVCVATTLMSVGNGVARIIADRHYMTDVIAGAAIGVATGFGMPILLHYGGVGTFTEVHPRETTTARTQYVVLPFVLPEGAGAVATGFF